MRNIKAYIGFFLLTLSTAGNIKAGLSIPFLEGAIELPDSADAAVANARSDKYTKALTPFDLQIRLSQETGATEGDYLRLAASQTQTWSESERKQLEKSVGEIESFLKNNNISLKLPATIQIIKTKGKEEFEAEGYTRENRIMLCIKPGQQLSTHLVAHELFHVYSRFADKKRDRLYSIFGFRKCNRINSAAAMSGRLITNPDCPVTEHYITLNGKFDAVLQLYSKKSYYAGFNLSNDVDVALLQVSGEDDRKVPVVRDGAGVLTSLDNATDFFQQVSMNTSYILHPEEIAAEHFAMMVIDKKVPQPAFIDEFRRTLQQ